MQQVEEKFPEENFRVKLNREMRDEILVYESILSGENGVEMQGKLCQNLNFKVFRARF